MSSAEIDEPDESEVCDTEPGEFRATIYIDLYAVSEEHAAEIAWQLAGEIMRAGAVTNATVESVY
jgi:hypothetical protein